ncbi:MAG: DUF4160 domain-containing protein [Acetomicrobium sp.]|nr:DUF4160 domain-containing protein [Acetomicrobium sp.]
MISIKDLAILEGKLSPKVLGIVVEWASQDQNELLEDWNLAQKFAELKKIPPLE